MPTLNAALTRGVAALLLLAPCHPAWADFKVFSPLVEQGEFEYEHNGDVTFDRNPYKGNEKSFTNELAYGFTSWWEPELELETDHQPAPGEHMRFTQLTLENTVQLTEAGEYWANFGFFGEYGQSLRHDQANETTFGPIIQKEWGQTVHTLNLFLEKELGSAQDPGAGYQVHYAWQSKWRLSESFEPGFEVYGAPGRIDRFSGFQDQELRAGPVVYGLIRSLGLGELRYQVGYLTGLTNGTAASTIRWQFEWEMRL
jgi:hypothetical protein